MNNTPQVDPAALMEALRQVSPLLARSAEEVEAEAEAKRAREVEGAERAFAAWALEIAHVRELEQARAALSAQTAKLGIPELEAQLAAAKAKLKPAEAAVAEAARQVTLDSGSPREPHMSRCMVEAPPVHAALVERLRANHPVRSTWASWQGALAAIETARDRGAALREEVAVHDRLAELEVDVERASRSRTPGAGERLADLTSQLVMAQASADRARPRDEIEADLAAAASALRAAQAEEAEARVSLRDACERHASELAQPALRFPAGAKLRGGFLPQLA